jgi:hypothetical protein
VLKVLSVLLAESTGNVGEGGPNVEGYRGGKQSDEGRWEGATCPGNAVPFVKTC